MDIILNIAIGGELGGTVPAGDFTYEMLVDYVRVYQGDWTATMEGDVVGPYVAAAEGVLALISDDYADRGEHRLVPLRARPRSVQTVDGGLRIHGVDYIGIEPATSFDLGAVDTFHVRQSCGPTRMRTLIFKLVNVNGVSDDTEVVSTVSYQAAWPRCCHRASGLS